MRATLCFRLAGTATLCMLLTACGGGGGSGASSTAAPAGAQATTSSTVTSSADSSEIRTGSTATTPTVTATSGDSAATLVWSPPLQGVDGRALPTLAGYRVYHGTDAEDLTPVAELNNPGLTSFVMERLASGVHYFAVTAYTSEGVESDWSNIGTKRVR